MSAPWYKVLRDLGQARGRSALVVLAIALGAATFFAVLASYSILTRSLNEGYRATNPASATLYVDRVDEAMLQMLRADPELSVVEPRRQLSGQVKTQAGTWQNLSLFVIEDFSHIRISSLTPEDGAWPPKTGEILIERDAFQVADAQIGDKLTVKTRDGTAQPLLISGSVKDVGQAQARMERLVYGYITPATLQLLLPEDQAAGFNQLKILVTEHRGDAAHIRRVVRRVSELIERSGHALQRVDIPEPGEHPHAAIMGMLLLAIACFGLFVLLLSGVLVVNLMLALMAAEIRAIGIMKAIGGSRWQIARIYLAQALCLGAAAVILAVPAGLLGSRLLSRYLAGFLNFNIAGYAVPAWTYCLVAAAGLLLPLLAAARPVWKGSGISVQDALAHTGLAATSFGTSAFDRLLAGCGGRSRPLLLAIRNSFRHRGRLIRTLLTLALGGLFFISALNLRQSLGGALDSLFQGRQFDLTLMLDQAAPLPRVERAIQATPGIVRAQGWIKTTATMAGIGTASTAPSADIGIDEAGFAILALPAGSDFQQLAIGSGRSLQQGDTNVMVVNNALAGEQPQLAIGNTVMLRMAAAGSTPMPWRIIGIASEPFAPPNAYVPKAYLDALHRSEPRADFWRLALRGHDEATIVAVKTALERQLQQQGLQVASLYSEADSRLGFDQHLLMIYVFLIAMACIIGAVGGLGLMTTMSLNVLERRRELGVMRALGASSAMVWLIIVTEAALIGLISWAIAALAAWPLSRGVGQLLAARLKSELPVLVDAGGVLAWLVAVVVLSIAASFVPAWHASRRPVRDAIG